MNAVERLYRRTAEGIQPGLEVMEALLEGLGNPERSVAVIHVAGTNGWPAPTFPPDGDKIKDS